MSLYIKLGSVGAFRTQPDERALREALASVARRTHQAGLVAATDGNLSARLAPDRFLMSRSGVSLRQATADDFVAMDAAGDA